MEEPVPYCPTFEGSSEKLPHITDDDIEFIKFKIEFKKTYPNSEYPMRKRKFYESKKLIESINANPKNTFRLELNQMADMWDCEYDKLTSFKDSTLTHQPELLKVAPYNFDDSLP